MKNRKFLVMVGVVAAIFVLQLSIAACGGPQTKTTPPKSTTQATTATTPASTAPVSSDTCLACHGPYDKVVQASAKYTTVDGAPVNPHTTIDISADNPHSTGKGTPDCGKCHQSHPVPLASPADVPAPKLDYCFSCHHEHNFTPCKQCHTDNKGGGA